jgi:hypothetical protein
VALGGSGADKQDQSRELELGVGVRVDFAVQIDLFVLRGYPFHGRVSLEMTAEDRKSIPRLAKKENGCVVFVANRKRKHSRCVPD